jgi:hypothetical protein
LKALYLQIDGGAVGGAPDRLPVGRISLTAGGLAMPSVDQLSNKGTLNILLDRSERHRAL